MTMSSRKPVIVVAEDDPVARGLIVAEISKAGFFAMAHGDGLSALEYFAMGERADALVTDVHMPGSVDGLFLAVEARAQRPYLPVVYTSAKSIRAQSMVPGARFVSKPYPMGQVVGTLRTAMDASAARMMAETWSLHAEIERRFLVTDDGWMGSVTGWRRLTDGVLGELRGVKIRVREDEGRAWLTVKGPREGLTRTEFEYEIPLCQARVMLDSDVIDEPVVKVRHLVPYAGVTWDVDVYQGRLAGIVIAEVEMRHETQEFDLPPWIGREVTGDARFGRKGLQALSWQSA
ncbi:response regulator [Methylobacterium sp. WL7]|uniref:response regulator n=1 Tax=Methylobacterium sp. WL7 TaxID=2603900 RepID=UPI0011CB61F0|nr:response regulator [Methylobacterium sp. WL7]TXN46568.1 response regulator [Methylobacterium sp. WL7]